MDGTMVIDDQNKDLNSWSWTNELINSLIQWLWVILAIWAIAMLVYSWFLMTISAGDDEKVKKWKELFKWTIIWFIALVSAWWLVSLLISFIFDFAGI
jgi:heme/copper-type cytochrome/quinol oxidase subunit 2